MTDGVFLQRVPLTPEMATALLQFLHNPKAALATAAADPMAMGQMHMALDAIARGEHRAVPVPRPDEKRAPKKTAAKPKTPAKRKPAP